MNWVLHVSLCTCLCKYLYGTCPCKYLIHMQYLHMPICSLHRKHSSLSGNFAQSVLSFLMLSLKIVEECKVENCSRNSYSENALRYRQNLNFCGCVRRRENLNCESLKARIMYIQEDNVGLLWKIHI